MQSFKPLFYIGNNHVQTFCGASKLRQKLILKRSSRLLRNTETVVLKTNDGVRLLAEFSKAKKSNGKLAIILHGWEGSSNSAYVVGSSNIFYNLGYHVARLNFRDHGDSHHLNKSPFNSVRLDEVCDAIINLSQRYPNTGIVLMGFSLGGNFALRLSANEKLQSLNLLSTIAICPAIDPVNASRSIERGWFYHQHFLKKWRSSLLKKYRYYPEIMETVDDLKIKRLKNMNDFFVPLHTEFASTEQYLEAYTITQETLAAIKSPCHIIYADDDPLIDARGFDQLSATEYVHIYPQAHGGHCAFLQDWHLNSWIESVIPELLKPTVDNPGSADIGSFVPGKTANTTN